jgi:hypothetical protein
VNVTSNIQGDSQSILIYPQPASGNELNLRMDTYSTDVDVLILSVEGKLIQRQRLKIDESGNLKLNISQLNAGIYFTEIRLPYEHIVLRWIKSSE